MEIPLKAYLTEFKTHILNNLEKGEHKNFENFATRYLTSYTVSKDDEKFLKLISLLGQRLYSKLFDTIEKPFILVVGIIHKKGENIPSWANCIKSCKGNDIKLKSSAGASTTSAGASDVDLTFSASLLNQDNPHHYTITLSPIWTTLQYCQDTTVLYEYGSRIHVDRTLYSYKNTIYIFDYKNDKIIPESKLTEVEKALCKVLDDGVPNMLVRSCFGVDVLIQK